MAKAPRVTAPPAPTPPPPPMTPPNGVEGGTPVDGEVLPVVEGTGVPEPTPVPRDPADGTPMDGTVPAGQGAGNRLPDVDPPENEAEPEGEEVQPEIGGKPIAEGDDFDALDDEQNAAALASGSVADEVFASLMDTPFDPSTNLGDWDGDGEPGGAAPAVVEKDPADKSNAELGTEVGIAHAGSAVALGEEGKPAPKPSRSQIESVVNEQGGKLPNGNALDDEFWTAYDQAFDRETEQLAADELSDEERLLRIEKTLGLLSPRS